MGIKENLSKLQKAAAEKFEEQFGFKLRDATFAKVVDYLHESKDSSSLAVTRILFGLSMLFDIPDERGGAALEWRWGDPKLCHFPLLPWLRPLAMPYMAVVYAALWMGALGIMLGYKYRLSSITFTLSYWYLLLIEKSYWNNHSYLFGLVAALLSCTDANCYWSLDVYRNPSKRRETVPYWNYFVLKYQFFILYFMAGVKKGSAEWLSGYSVQNLSEHWVFAPFRLFLTVPQTDYLIVHWFIFAFDLSVAVWMMWARSRHLAMVLCALFHLMNSRLFRIGMFPWVCLATMPLFYPFDWPKRTIEVAKQYASVVQNFIWGINKRYFNSKDCQCNIKNAEATKQNDGQKAENQSLDTLDCKEITDQYINKESVDIMKQEENNKELVDAFLDKDDLIHENKQNSIKMINNKFDTRYFTVYMIIFYVMTQAFLPFSHFITKGYNNWTDGLYGYSWDMMVHTWDAHSVIVKIVDNESKSEFFVDPYMFTPNDRWSRHGDMVFQYAHCLKNKVAKRKNGQIFRNVSIYIDVWCSMNGRFIQRMFDPRVDLLKAAWSPFKPIPFLMPVLDEALTWRTTLDEIRTDVNSWSNYSDVTFFADFPGYYQEKFIPNEVRNVSLTVLEGVIVYEPEVTEQRCGHSILLNEWKSVDVESGRFHKVLNIGDTPAFYMYTFYNSTEAFLGSRFEIPKPKLPIGNELWRRFKNMATFANSVAQGIFQILRIKSQCYLGA